MIIVDSREKKWEHIRQYFEKNNIPYEVKKLDEGDYQIKGIPAVTVDRKKDLTEMYNCMVSDRGRFMREVRRCMEKRIKLIVLIEHGGQIRSILDVAKWKPKYGRLSGREISKRLHALTIAYGVIVEFCDKRCTGRRILEILERYAKIKP